MKKILLLLFIPFVSFGQEITISSTESEILIYSEETLNLLESNYSDMGLYGYVSQTKWVDFDNDGHKDIITSVAGDPYRPAILCIFLWDESSQKFIEDNQYLMIVQGEPSFWSETVGDFNGDGLNDVYVPVSNYHGEEGQQPDYYPENTYNMPGHLFLNNGSGFDSQFIDPTIMDWGYPNYERGFVLDVDNDDILDIIVPSVNQHPENNWSEPFLASKYNVSAQNEITRDFIYPWEDTYNTSSGFFMQAHSIMFNEYNNNIYVLYQGNEESTDNGPYSYPEVSIYSKEIDSNGNFILLDKFRLERGNNDINHDSYVNRTSFYIEDLDGDGNEEFIIQMFTENAVPHAGLHVFDHTGQEITQDWFIEDSSLGHSANGFFFQDLNNDGNVDLLMSDKYTEDQNEIVIYLNNVGQFVKKIVELDDGGFYYPIDVNNDGFFELLQLVSNSGTLADNYQAEIHYLNYSDTSCSITAPPDITIVGCDNISNFGEATSDCSDSSVFNDAPSSFNLGENLITWTITSESGDVSSDTQTVTVIDDVNPTITAPTSVDVFSNNECTAINVSLGSATTSDNCSVSSVTNDAPTAYEVGETTVTWTVTDASGNTATATQTVTVTDDTNPTVLCNDLTLTLEEGIAVISALDLDDGSFDECGEVELSINQTEFDESHIGDNIVALTVTDEYGNSSSCETTVTVEAGMGIEDNILANIYLYPNPTSDLVFIGGVDSELNAVVYDLLGKQVMRKYITKKININILEKGVYFVKLSNGINYSVHKIIKN